MALQIPVVSDLSEEDQKAFWTYMVGNFVMDEINPFRTIISKAKEVRKELKSKFDAIKLKHGLQDKEISQLLMLANTDMSPFSKEEHKHLLNYKDKATGPLYIFSETLTKDYY